ncbi:protein NIM1-INTERACTING 1-like [Pyrus communis]|uniref:protein NIM1-INTERACTING 1-like n=1 Tax=Pyrus communis TaxID=23211 RepID=UPI0035BF34C5
MEGGSKKRKMEIEEEDEEEKIEKFFALIRSMREVRELLRGNSNVPKEKTDEKKKEDGKAAGGWNPKFQPEDFLEDVKNSGHHGAGPSKTEEKEDKEENGGGNAINLNLSL